jgi:hypothetical protein
MFSTSIIEDMTLGKVKKALQMPPSPVKRDRNFRTCNEINNCSLPSLLECRAFIKQKPCWLLSKDCLCSHHSHKNCDTCGTYDEHKKDFDVLLVGNPRRMEFPGKTFLDYIRPVINDFLPSGGKFRSADSRRERSLNRIAVNFLKFWLKDKKGSYEKQLMEIYKELFIL